jgi:hypothetical protein
MACAPCHPQEYRRQSQSRHAHALSPILQSPVADALLKSAPPGSIQYAARPGGIAATAKRDGVQTTGVLEWAFGAGAQGITPAGRLDGQYFEHRFSYYPAAGRMAVTFGHPATAATSRAELGLPQSAHIITACFKCHSTGVREDVKGPDLSAMQPGIQCERCHGPGRQHIALAQSNAALAEVRGALINPGRLPAKAQVEFCGQCHRLPAAWSDIPEPELEDPVVVRFAPVGLMASRCFIESKRLACLSCHDPHADAASRSGGSYTAACIACHSTPPPRGSSCRRAVGDNCLPCHMRQASLSAFLKFTDHRIRVYR